MFAHRVPNHDCKNVFNLSFPHCTFKVCVTLANKIRMEFGKKFDGEFQLKFLNSNSQSWRFAGGRMSRHAELFEFLTLTTHEENNFHMLNYTEYIKYHKGLTRDGHVSHVFQEFCPCFASLGRFFWRFRRQKRVLVEFATRFSCSKRWPIISDFMCMLEEYNPPQLFFLSRKNPWLAQTYKTKKRSNKLLWKSCAR